MSINLLSDNVHWKTIITSHLVFHLRFIRKHTSVQFFF